MAVTIDNRPTVFGDRMIITGSTDGAEAIDLSDFLSSIDGAMDGKLVGSNDGDIDGLLLGLFVGL